MDSNPIIHFLIQVVTLRGSFNWGFVHDHLLDQLVIQGVILTVLISIIAQLIGSVIGLLLYFLRRSRVGVLRFVSERYIWIFRGTPLIVQILLIYAAMPYLGIANPLENMDLFGHFGFQNDFLDAFIAGCIALSLNEGAYMAEIVRAGIDSIDIGQLEAAKSLGMTYRQAMRRIVIPQALRIIVPPLGNEFNSMLKSSSLVYVTGFNELFGIARTIGDPVFRDFEMMVVASVWYIAMTTAWGFVQSYLERRLNASNIDPALRDRGGWLQRAFGRGRPKAEPAPGIATPAGIDHR